MKDPLFKAYLMLEVDELIEETHLIEHFPC